MIRGINHRFCLFVFQNHAYYFISFIEVKQYKGGHAGVSHLISSGEVWYGSWGRSNKLVTLSQHRPAWCLQICHRKKEVRLSVRKALAWHHYNEVSCGHGVRIPRRKTELRVQPLHGTGRQEFSLAILALSLLQNVIIIGPPPSPHLKLK